jgi:hypothetical protein
VKAWRVTILRDLEGIVAAETRGKAVATVYRSGKEAGYDDGEWEDWCNDGVGPVIDDSVVLEYDANRPWIDGFDHVFDNFVESLRWSDEL